MIGREAPVDAAFPVDPSRFSNEDSLKIYVRDGDPAVFAELMHRLKSPGLASARKILGRDVAAAEDALQEAFLRLCKRPSSFFATSVEACFVTAVANIAKTMRSKEKTRHPPGEPRAESEIPGYGRPYETESHVEAVRVALATLPDYLLEPAVLHYGLGYSVREIGDALGLPKSVVYDRLQQAHERIVQVLKLGVELLGIQVRPAVQHHLSYLIYDAKEIGADTRLVAQGLDLEVNATYHIREATAGRQSTYFTYDSARRSA